MFKLNVASHLQTHKNWYVLAMAIALGASGTYLAKNFIQERVAAAEAKLRGNLQTVSVVVPKQDLPAGVRVDTQAMAIREVPREYVHRDAVTPQHFELAEGQRLSFQVDGGRPLLWAHLESGRTPTFSAKLPNGMRALTVPVDEVNSISGMLQPKDKIDLILTTDRLGNRPEKITFPLLQDVEVVATGVQVQPERDGAGRAEKFRTVTLQVTPADANRVILAQESGKLTAVLRHPDDAKPQSGERITVAHLLGETRATPRPKEPGVHIIIGGK